MAFSVGSRRFPYYPALCSLVHFVLVEECVQVVYISFCFVELFKRVVLALIAL